MITVLLVSHGLIAIALIIVVLLQKSEGGGLGIGSGSGMGGFMTARGAASMLTRTTAVLAGLFMAMSILLAMLAGRPSEQRRSIIDGPPERAAPAPSEPVQDSKSPNPPSNPTPPVAR